MTEKPNSKSNKSDEPAPRRMLRSRDDRVIAGVASGLARNLNINPTLVRIGFVASLLFGGLGAIAYLVLAIVIPEGDESGRPVERAPGEPHPAVRVIAIGLLIAVVAVAAVALAAVSAWTTATGSGAIAAGVVIALGVTLAATAASGRAATWLIVPALAIALPAGAIAASDIRFSSDIGRSEHTPATAAEIPEDGYELGVGQLVVDLQEMEWHPRQTVHLRTDLGVGQTIVSVPPRVCVAVDAHSSGGELYVRGERHDGVDPDFVDSPMPNGIWRLELDSEVDFGQLIVSDRPAEELASTDHPSYRDDSQERIDADAACALRPG
jgi:phage shock protein PspC (stress-responsive transcriptional regulator)